MYLSASIIQTDIILKIFMPKLLTNEKIGYNIRNIIISASIINTDINILLEQASGLTALHE